MQLRNLQIPTGAVFAPMAGLTDAACRHLMADHGAAWTVSEMASAKALNFGDRKSLELLKDEHPHGLYAIQLFGAEPESMAKAILFVREKGIRFDILDINMGCPAPKVAGNGGGSALMRDPALAEKIVRAAVRAVDLPVTVKMRTGFDNENISAPEIAKRCENAGAAAVTGHGRTRPQMYAPGVDYKTIAEVRKSVRIPVIGNGDVTGGSSAIAMRDYTGCDGIMIARGALGNPYVFQEVKAAFAGVPYTPPSNAERLDLAIAHVRGLVAHKGPHGVIEMRKHIAYYVRGMKGASAFRTAATLAPTAEALIDLIEEYKDSISE